MCTTDEEVYRLRNMFCKLKYIVFKIKILLYCCVVHLTTFNSASTLTIQGIEKVSTKIRKKKEKNNKSTL